MPPWPSHYKSKLHTPPFHQLQSTPDSSSSYTAFLVYQTPSSYTSSTGSIVFCLAASRLINSVQFAAPSQPAFINIIAGSFAAHVRRVTVALFVLQLALLPMMAIASDANPEQELCVADPNNPTVVNGLVCKNPAFVKANNFMFIGLATPRNTNDPLGSSVTTATAAQFPGINTLGISMARLDFAKGGLVPPHTHSRATEIIFVVEGSLFVGLVGTN
jgi:hypothetical protein